MQATPLRGIGLALVLLVVVPCASVCAQISIQLPGSVQPGTYTGNSIDFGDVKVGTTKTVAYRFGITSTSSTAGSLTFIGFQGGFYKKPPFALTNLPSLPKNIAPGGSITFNVTFTPTTAQTYTNQFTITVSGGRPLRTQQQTVTLTGTGVSYGGSIIDGDQAGYTATYEAARLEAKLDALEPNVATLETKLDLAQQDTAKLEAKLDELRQKLDNLAGILGEWIVGRGQQFYIDTGTTVYNPTPPSEGIKTEIETLERQINTLLTECCTSEPAEEELLPLPLEVTENSGERFRHFLSLADQLLVRTSQDVFTIDPEDSYTQSILAGYSRFILAGRAELSQLVKVSQEASLPIQAYLDYVVLNGAPELLYDVISGGSTTPKFQFNLDAAGESLVGTILSKAGKGLMGIPFVGGALQALCDDIATLFEGASSLAKMLGVMNIAQLELEKKLDGIIKGLFGIRIPLSASERELQDLLRGIPSTSLTEDFSKAAETSRQNQKALQTLEEKICCLAHGIGRWLGNAIYGSEKTGSEKEGSAYANTFYEGIMPYLCKNKKYSCYMETESDALPAIKPELKNLEEDMSQVKETLERILKELEGLRREPDTYPPDGEPPCCCALTKKIYVYDEGSFSATKSSDSHEIVVTTRSFDVSGWIDLSELRPGDQVEVELWVRVANKERLFIAKEFEGGADSRLIHFCELTGHPRGCPELVGTWIKIVLTQPISADDFSVPTEIGYQFIVESQN